MYDQLKEQKSILARLMASENINVRHAKVPTAGFNPTSRTLILPILKEMEGDVYDLFVCHEVGHALYTPAEGWHRVIEKRGPNYKAFLNIVEDARIEKLIKRKFAGAGKAMHKGYKVLVHDRDFFGLKQYNIDIDSAALIDKLNIHFKGGPLENVKFTEDEKPFIEKMEKLETWEDVEKLAEELWTYAEENEEDQMTCTDDMSMEDSVEYDEDDEDEWEDFQDSYERESDNDCDSPVDKCDNSDQPENNTDGNDEGGSSEEGEQEKDNSEGETKAEDSSNEKEEESESEGGESSGGGYDQWHADNPWKAGREPKSITDQTFREKEEELVHEDALDLKYYTSPKINLKHKGPGGRPLIMGYKELLKRSENALADREKYLVSQKMTTLDWGRESDLMFGYAKEYLKYVDKENKPVVNYLIKEFEMKKKAAEYKRSQTANSGVISLSDIHKYKYSDNIFKKITIVPEGKNHGLYFLMDWSGSMSEKIMPTLIQLFQLIDFCRKCNISHEAYAFVDYSYTENGRSLTVEEEFGLPFKPEVDSLAVGDIATQLVEIFSHKMSAKEFNTQREYLLLSILRCDKDFQQAPWLDEKKERAQFRNRLNGNSRARVPQDTIPYLIFNSWAREKNCRTHWEWNTIGRFIKFPLERLCGTPLNDAIMISTDNVRRFQRENNLDIVNTIILSDGESNSSHRFYSEEKMKIAEESGNPYDAAERISTTDCKIKLVDRETKKVFEWTAVHGMRQTENFLNYFKFKTGSNVIGFFLTSSPDDAGRVVGWRDWTEQRSQYNRLGYLIAQSHGYDELYVIKTHSSVLMEDEIKVNTEKKNTTATLAKAFSKFQKGKLDKRIMLQSFAEKVA